MSDRYAIVITAYDGTVSVCGTFADEDRAASTAEKIETLAVGVTTGVNKIESPSSVLASMKAHGARI